MERAAKAVRRSGVKLLSLGGGHGELNMVISEQKDVKNTAKAFMAAQNSAAQYLVKWATNEENRAIQDVSHHINELNQIWTEAQREFVEQLKEFKHMFDLVLEGEKHVDHAKANLFTCEQREAKIKKELKKVAKKATPEELRVLESRLAQAERQKDLAVIEVEDKIRENEAVKLIRFKDGYQKLSLAYMELSRKCGIIFEAQRDITTQLPDVLNRDLEDIKYTGSGANLQFVSRAKERVRQYKRQQKQNAVTMPALDDVEPPPPYTPGDFYDNPYDNPYPTLTNDLQPMPNRGNTTTRPTQVSRSRQPAISTLQQPQQSYQPPQQTLQEPLQEQLPQLQNPQTQLQPQPLQQQPLQQQTLKQQPMKQQPLKKQPLQQQPLKQQALQQQPLQQQSLKQQPLQQQSLKQQPLQQQPLKQQPLQQQPLKQKPLQQQPLQQQPLKQQHMQQPQQQLQHPLQQDQFQQPIEQQQQPLQQQKPKQHQQLLPQKQPLQHQELQQQQDPQEQPQLQPIQQQKEQQLQSLPSDQPFQELSPPSVPPVMPVELPGDGQNRREDREPEQGTECVINDLNWCSEDEDAYLSGAMGGMRL